MILQDRAASSQNVSGTPPKIDTKLTRAGLRSVLHSRRIRAAALGPPPRSPVGSEAMTLQELMAETLVEKNSRIRREKCPHEEVYSSTVTSDLGSFTNRFCLDCGAILTALKGEKRE